MAPRRALPVGKLTLHGREHLFQPASMLFFEGRPGEEVELVLEYYFEEDNRSREHCRIQLSAQFPGESPLPDQVVVKDRLGIHDIAKGTLATIVRFPYKGTLHGTILVEAYYTTGSWTGEAKVEADVREHATFTLKA